MITEGATIITGSDLYWITRMDNIIHAMIPLSIVCGIVSAVGVVLCCVCASKERPSSSQFSNDRVWPEEVRCHFVGVRLVRIFTPMLFVFMAALVLVPTTREIVAIKVIPAIANNADVQGLGKDMIETARAWLNELKPSVSK